MRVGSQPCAPSPRVHSLWLVRGRPWQPGDSAPLREGRAQNGGVPLFPPEPCPLLCRGLRLGRGRPQMPTAPDTGRSNASKTVLPTPSGGRPLPSPSHWSQECPPSPVHSRPGGQRAPKSWHVSSRPRNGRDGCHLGESRPLCGGWPEWWPQGWGSHCRLLLGTLSAATWWLCGVHTCPFTWAPGQKLVQNKANAGDDVWARLSGSPKYPPGPLRPRTAGVRRGWEQWSWAVGTEAADPGPAMALATKCPGTGERAGPSKVSVLHSISEGTVRCP